MGNRPIRYGSWQNPIPRWLGYSLFTTWMIIFGVVLLFLLGRFMFPSGHGFCYAGASWWFWVWCDAAYHGVFLWIIATVVFLAFVVVHPPEHALRNRQRTRREP